MEKARDMYDDESRLVGDEYARPRDAREDAAIADAVEYVNAEIIRRGLDSPPVEEGSARTLLILDEIARREHAERSALPLTPELSAQIQAASIAALPDLLIARVECVDLWRASQRFAPQRG